MRHFASVILVDPSGRVLLQERDEHPVIDPECWGLPGGHVEEGEGIEQAAYRELAEETGVELAPGTLEAFADFDVWHQAYGSLDRIHVWVAACDLTDADIDCREGRQMVFVAPERFADLPLSAGLAAIAPRFWTSDFYRSHPRQAS